MLVNAPMIQSVVELVLGVAEEANLHTAIYGIDRAGEA